MEKFEGDFLKDKYWGNKGFREATESSADRTKKREGRSVPDSPQERIENYLNRFSEITGREDENRREAGIEAIQRLVERKYIIKPENIGDEYIKNVLLGNEAELLGYEREDIKTESVRETVLSSLEKKIRSPLSTYSIPAETRKELEDMVINDQKSRMKQWLWYLTEEESSHMPVALRYWAFAEMLKQGDFDPVRGEYNKRVETTVAVFPELDQQALALVFDEITRHRTGQASSLTLGDENSQAELEALLKTENFGKLYARMQEHVRSLRLPSEQLAETQGEWRTFPQGSSAKALTEALQGFQTKWCIAGEGHASSYLSRSDVIIYFSRDALGGNTIPRACIVNDKSQGITEVRGIMFNKEVKQHLDDYIIPVVDGKLKEMEGGEKWSNTMTDMKKLRLLHMKHARLEEPTQEDLRFLYEIDRPIRESGYGKDPRIDEILKGRDKRQDLSSIFNCRPEQISLTREEALKGDIVFHYGDLDLSDRYSAKGLILPQKIGGDLNLSNLQSAEGLTLPQTIGGSLSLYSLKSAEGLTLPQTIGGDLNLSNLQSAEGLTLPQTIGGNLFLSSIQSAEGLTLPQTIGRGLFLSSIQSAKDLVLPQTIGRGLFLSSIQSAKDLVLPQTIGGNLNLSKLQSAEGLTLPQTIGGSLNLYNLQSAEGLVLPQTIGGGLDLRNLQSAEGLTLPQTIGGDLDLPNLQSAKGLTLPQTIGGNLFLSSIQSAEGLILPSSIGRKIYLNNLPHSEKIKLKEKYPQFADKIY